MPRVLKRSKQRLAGLTEHHIREFEHGHAWEFLGPGESFKGDLKRMRVAWEELREQVLASWIRKNPGTRPYAWWEFDAPERRRPLDGRVHPFDNPAREKHIKLMRAENPNYCTKAHSLWFGCLASYLFRDDFDTCYETELDYLVRLRLIGDEEQEAAQEAAWQA